MTIAVCYVSPEGIVLGADSTASLMTADGPHYFNHAQKLFEIGEEATLGVVTWGLGGFASVSYRSLFARLADDLKQQAPTDVREVMDRWIDLFAWAYDGAYLAHPDFAQLINRVRFLHAKPPPDPANQAARTDQEEKEYQGLRRFLTVGFCIGGRAGEYRSPAAYFVQFDPTNMTTPGAIEIPVNSSRWFGVPNMIQRLVNGADDETKKAIVDSTHWHGSANDLDGILAGHQLTHPLMPLRDIVDFVHACIYSTIKALKFSLRPQVCGGPIELAVISSDRKFRWIRHKTWDAAVVDGAPT